eukprot:GHVR01171352.1.p1 GENE.GHVR01171352.1~~GHVR01171352.1.p1  ORF type:complete len:122 (+),score=9.91 GHVR01171352.1:367-732(+)
MSGITNFRTYRGVPVWYLSPFLNNHMSLAVLDCVPNLYFPKFNTRGFLTLSGNTEEYTSWHLLALSVDPSYRIKLSLPATPLPIPESSNRCLWMPCVIIYIYIHICVCVCLCVCLSVFAFN